jgi:hypothetical protein
MLVGALAGLALPARTDNRVADRLCTLLASTPGQTGALSVKDASTRTACVRGRVTSKQGRWSRATPREGVKAS